MLHIYYFLNVIMMVRKIVILLVFFFFVSLVWRKYNTCLAYFDTFMD